MCTDAENPEGTRTESGSKHAVVTPARPEDPVLIKLATLSTRVEELHKAVRETGTLSKMQFIKVGADILKAAISGWPTFGLIFLILFYAPLRDAINSIPERVKNADEIHMGVVSLKGAIKMEAVRSGAISLPAIIPTLTPVALERLFQTNRYGDGFWSYGTNKNDEVTTLYFKDKAFMESIRELDAAGLLTISATEKQKSQPEQRIISAKEAEEIIDSIRKRFPGKHNPSRVDVYQFDFDTSVPLDRITNLTFTLSELGTQAINVILKAVAVQLSERRSGGGASQIGGASDKRPQ